MKEPPSEEDIKNLSEKDQLFFKEMQGEYYNVLAEYENLLKENKQLKEKILGDVALRGRSVDQCVGGEHGPPIKENELNELLVDCRKNLTSAERDIVREKTKSDTWAEHIEPYISSVQEKALLDFFKKVRSYYKKRAEYFQVPIGLKRLFIEDSFINLTIVSEEEQREKKQDVFKNFESKRNQVEEYDETYQDLRDEQINLFEKIYNVRTRFIPEQLFSKQNNEDKNPKRILIWGRAGIGKSIFCQKLAYQWAIGKPLWKKIPDFSLVVWIKLREIVSYLEKIPNGELDYNIFIADFLLNKNDPTQIKRNQLNALAAGQLNKSEDTILYLLDGYDEIVRETEFKSQLESLLEELLKKPYYILTSRPYYKLPIEECLIDRTLEIMGLNDSDILEYTKKNLEEPARQALDTALEDNNNLKGIAHIPLNLSILCSLVEEDETILSSLQNGSITEIYFRVTDFLFRKYRIQHERIIKEEISAYKWMMENGIVASLGELAFTTLSKNELIFSAKSVYKVIENKNDRHSHAMRHCGVLHGLTKGFIEQDLSASKIVYFIHLTFQEYFFAWHVYHVFETDQYDPVITPYLKFENEVINRFIGGIFANNDENNNFLIFLDKFLESKIHKKFHITNLNDLANLLIKDEGLINNCPEELSNFFYILIEYIEIKYNKPNVNNESFDREIWWELFNEVGIAHRRKVRTIRAIDMHLAAFNILKNTKNIYFLKYSVSCAALRQLYMYAGKFQSASSFFEKVELKRLLQAKVDKVKNENDRTNNKRIINILLDMADTGSFEEKMKRYEEAKSLAESHGFFDLAAKATAEISCIHMHFLNITEAIENGNEALDFMEKSGLKEVKYYTTNQYLMNIAWAYSLQGKIIESKEILKSKMIFPPKDKSKNYKNSIYWANIQLIRFKNKILELSLLESPARGKKLEDIRSGLAKASKIYLSNNRSSNIRAQLLEAEIEYRLTNFNKVKEICETVITKINGSTPLDYIYKMRCNYLLILTNFHLGQIVELNREQDFRQCALMIFDKESGIQARIKAIFVNAKLSIFQRCEEVWNLIFLKICNGNKEDVNNHKFLTNYVNQTKFFAHKVAICGVRKGDKKKTIKKTENYNFSGLVQQRENYFSVECNQRIKSNDVEDSIIPEAPSDSKIEQLILEYALHSRKLGNPQPFYNWLHKKNHSSYLRDERVNANQANLGKESTEEGLNLSKLNLSKVDFMEAKFHYANITDTDFTESDLTEADLSFVKGLTAEQLWWIKSDINSILIDENDGVNRATRDATVTSRRCMLEEKAKNKRLKETQKKHLNYFAKPLKGISNILAEPLEASSSLLNPSNSLNSFRRSS